MNTKDALPLEGTTADSTGAVGQIISAVNRPQGKFDVDANGQAVYRIPIEVPPGVAGCQPRLELAYSHRQANSVLGVGWSLSGLSSITRTKATYAVDGFNGAVSYDANDRFALDGQRLINVQGEYGQAGTVYLTELQSWNQVVAAASPADGFTVTTKSGEVWRFGATPDSRILAAGGQQVRVWALSSVTDRNGNSVHYGYTQTPLLSNASRGPADAGAYYIDLISYNTGNGATANRFVQFIYETRPDPITDYVGGFPVMTSYRLTNINAYLAGNNPARSYALSYRTSQATQLSCLASITEAGADGTSTLLPTTMTWQDVPTPGFDIGQASQLNQHLDQVGIQQMDVSGSGLTDIVQLWLDQNNALNATTYLATPGANGPTFVWAADSLLDSFPQEQKILPVDVNGDGLTDLLVAYKGANGNLKLAVFLSNGKGFTAAPSSPFDTGDSWYDAPVHLQFFAMDANGDGRTDLVEAYAHNDPTQGNLLYFRTYLSNVGDTSGALFTNSIVSPTEDAANPTQPLAFWALDVNGDGMVDLVRVWQRGSDSHIIATAYVSTSTAIDNVTFATQVQTDLGTFSLSNQIAFFPIDVNGDGMTDLLHVWQEQDQSGTTLHLTTFLGNAGGGFAEGLDTPFTNLTLTSGEFYPMGFNGGGQAALVSKWISGNDELMFTVFPATPSGHFRLGPTVDAGPAGSAVQNASFFPGDVNGDGKADLIRMSFDGNQQPSLVPYTSSGAYPDLVGNITNPLGGVVNVTYSPLSDPSVYGSGDASIFPQASGRRFPHPLTPTVFPTQAVLGQATYVVSGYTQSNNAGRNRFGYESVYALSYTGAQLNLLGRGWEGFRSVSKLDQQSGRNTIQIYNQDFPFTGTLASTLTEANGSFATDPRVPKDQSAVLMSVDSTTYQAFQRAAGATGLKTPVVEVLKTASLLQRYNYGVDHFDYATAQSFAYDDFGNQTVNVELGYVDQNGNPLDPSEVVYRYNLYQNDILPNGWALGFPLYAKVSSNASDADIKQFLPGDFHLTQKTYTPSTYNLASEGRWDNVHNSFLTVGYGYDAFGNRIRETHPDGSATQYDFDPDYNTFQMRVTSPPDEQGVSLVTVYGYDPRFGVEVAHRDANNDITVMGLDAFGRKALRQGPVPAIPGAVGDANALTALVTGTPELRQAFLSASVVTLETTNYLDDRQGGIYTEAQTLQTFPVDTARDFNWKQKYVDGLGREREVFSESGQSAGNITTLTDYDSSGQVSAQSLPFFSATANVSQAPHSILSTFDVLGRPLTHQTPAGQDGGQFSITTWEYQSGGVVTMTSASSSNTPYTQVFVHHLYDGQDKVRQSTLPADGNATTTFTYDPIGRLANATDPATTTSPQGISNTITYDSLDRKLTFDNPDQNTTNDPNVKAMTYEYDPTTGRLQRQIDAAGQATVFAYDNLDRLASKTLSDGRVQLYTYDEASTRGAGRLSHVKVMAADQSVESQYDFDYDAYGNIITSTLTVAGEAAPFNTTSSFDPQQRMIGQTLPDGSQLVREYSFGQLVSQTLDGARADYPLEQYDAAGKARQLIYGQGTLPGPGVVTNYTYNPAGQMYGEVVNGSAGVVLNLAYGYDLLGQLLGVTDSGGSGFNQTFTYLNKRLQSALVPGFDAASYDYDASGNLTTKEGVVFTYRAHFPVSGTANGSPVYTATPDACGRTMTRVNGSGTQLNFEYDGLGSLCRVSNATSGATLRQFLSDYTGRRLRQTTEDGTRVIHVSPSYQVTLPPAGAASVTKYLLDERGVAASVTTVAGSAARVLYFRRDHKGSITHTFGPDGAVASVVSYSGYGQLNLLSGPDDFRPKYEHKAWDAEIGLYYFGARYYDPLTGRFLTPDSQLGGQNYLQADVLNRYAFELNNPVNHTDQSGHMAKWVGGLLIGLAAVAIGAIVILSFGTAAPLAVAIISGALIAGGISGAAYSVTHQNNFSWKDYGIQVGISAGIGALSGGAFYGLSAATSSIAVLGSTATRSFATSVIGSALISGTADVTSQFLTNLAEGQSLSNGLANAAIFGTLFGAAGGALGFGFGKAVARYTVARYGEEIEEQVVRQESAEWRNLNVNHANEVNSGRLTSFPIGADERTPILQARKIEEVMNGRGARFLQLLLSNTTAFPEAYLENRQS
ncbi:MAG TPA: RHS repeat-associated core domain-containing protein [Pyrinomonadaceae bacterium]